MGRHEESIETPFLAMDDDLDDETIVGNPTRSSRSGLSKTHRVLFVAQIIFGIGNFAFLIWNMVHIRIQFANVIDCNRPEETLC